MKAITAAVIAILNVNIRFRALVRRSSMAKRRSRSKSRRRILVAEASMTSPARESQPLVVELDPENETVGERGALPLEGADGAGAGHEADTQGSQCRVHGQGGAGSNQGRPDGGRAGERIWGSSEPDLQVEEAAAGRRGERVRGWRLGVGGSGQRGTG